MKEKDIFVYQWILRDKQDYDDEGRQVRYLEVNGYGIDTKNQTVFIQLERGASNHG